MPCEHKKCIILKCQQAQKIMLRLVKPAERTDGIVMVSTETMAENLSRYLSFYFNFFEIDKQKKTT